MSQVITFCDQTINKVIEEIEKTKQIEAWQKQAHLRRKFSKQNLAENKPNNSVKKSILNARSAIVRVETPTEVHAAKQTKNNKNEALQNEIEIVKKEIESMKKDHSVVSQIATRRQLLPHPRSKSSSKKEQLKPHRKNKKTRMQPP